MFLPQWEILYKKGSIAMYTEIIQASDTPKDILHFSLAQQCYSVCIVQRIVVRIIFILKAIKSFSLFIPGVQTFWLM